MQREQNNLSGPERRRLTFSAIQGAHLDIAKAYIDKTPELKRLLRVCGKVSESMAIMRMLNEQVTGNARTFTRYTLTDVMTLKDWVINAEKNVPSSSKKIDVEFNDQECKVMMNDNVVKYLSMGFDIKGEGQPVFKTQMTEKMVETAVSVLEPKNGTFEPVFNTKKFHAPLAMMDTPQLRLATSVANAELTTRSEVVSVFVETVKEDVEAAEIVVAMAPPMFAPEVLQDSRGFNFLKPSAKAVPDLGRQSYNAFLKHVNGMAKKTEYGSIANGHLIGHYFGVDHKYVTFLADFRTFDIPGDVVIHTADQQYAITVANYYEKELGENHTRKITIIGANVKSEARYNTTFALRIGKVRGTHIIPDCSAMQSQPKISIFESAVDQDNEVKKDLEEIKGAIYRKVKVFALVPDADYILSASMGNMECWEYIEEKVDAVQEVPIPTATVVDHTADNESQEDAGNGQQVAEGNSEQDNGEVQTSEGTVIPTSIETEAINEEDNDDGTDDEDGEYDDTHCLTMDEMRDVIAYHVMHWYLYPWTRIPLRCIYDQVVEMDGEYDLRMKKEDVIGYCSNSSTDETVKAFLDNIKEFSAEIVDLAKRQRPAPVPVRPASSNNNNNAHNSNSLPAVTNNTNNTNANNNSNTGVYVFDVASDPDDDEEEDEPPVRQAVVPIKLARRGANNSNNNNNNNSNGVARRGGNVRRK